MRGQKRTKEEQHELFLVLEGYLKMGFSLKKACSLADLPYSTMRETLPLPTSHFVLIRGHYRTVSMLPPEAI